MSAADPTFEPSSVRLRELALKVDPAWRMIVARAPIEACELRFDFVCPKQWNALEPTELGDDVRFCGSCKKNVHYSASVDEAAKHARQGRCVVVDLVQLRRPRDLDGPDPVPMPMLAGAPIYHPPPPIELEPVDSPPSKPRGVFGRLKALLQR